MRLFLLALCLAVEAVDAQTASLSPSEHDFGAVRQGVRVSHAFPLRNTGASTLKIDKVELSAEGVTVRFPAVIEPGAQANLQLEWNTGQSQGETEGVATLFTNDPAAPQQTIRFKALVQPPVEFQPFPAVFFSAYTDQTPEKSVRIINHEEQPLKIQRVEAPPRFEVSLNEVRAGQEYDVRVKVRNGSVPGRTSEPIFLHTANPARPVLRVVANLFVKPDVYAFPEEIAFGSVKASDLAGRPQLVEMLEQRTVITNREGPMELQEVTSNLPFLRITREPERGPARQFLLKIDVDPAKMKTGKFQGAITVRTTDPKHPVLFVPVTAAVL